ncbi:oxidoreductase [Spongiactinospora rosea]|uniref:Oxidoreductase n=1 Tax=Spongiactinospora rosea TaxID=2248750 RepID=A0A366LQL7_9ACTN|nr:PhzF family phenazine biosynthesis protein [Spongiactinospora rosea]RBQ15492.1 oxidoreductase [Spongiactinospora rosea]
MRMFTVDAFTRQPFQGNPAAVCLLDFPADDTWMQSLAAEMNLSETAFVTGLDSGRPYSLRWFTPAVEVALCGHATLATAHVLYSIGAASGTIEFSTLSGILTVSQGSDNMITMDFPAAPPKPTTPPAGLAEALGATPLRTARAREDLLVELESAHAVQTLTPDIAALREIDARGVIVTARASNDDTDRSGSVAGQEGSEQPHFVSRFFAPRVGVNEDPVTGSAHCALAPYWSAQLGEKDLLGHQLSARGGLVHTSLRGDRVILGGHAVTVMTAELHSTPG